MRTLTHLVLFCLALGVRLEAATERLESPTLSIEVQSGTGDWALTDRLSGVRYPTNGFAAAGSCAALVEPFTRLERPRDAALRLVRDDGVAVTFELVHAERSVELRFEGNNLGQVEALGAVLRMTAADQGSIVVPCREGLLIPVTGDKAFRRTFATSDYEGCHMNMIGILKAGAAALVTWDDAYTFAEIERTLDPGTQGSPSLTARFKLQRTARSLRLTPLGKGDWNTLAERYRQLAEEKKLAVTLLDKQRRNPRLEQIIGAANVKLWHCLARRMSEDSSVEQSVKVRWTFDEAARIAEHIRKDLHIERCLFILGGFTEGGYDCRHPDNLPANPECGGNEALRDAIERIGRLGYVACLHDNYQDMYRNAKSFDFRYIEKDTAGKAKRGGRWLGGRPWLVCAPMQLELAMRSQNLPEIHRLFNPGNYFIDTTYAVGPRQCSDPNHPLDRNADIHLKNTQELLGPLHQETACVRLRRFEFLSPDGKLRRATYGSGATATQVVVNSGQQPVQVTSRYGGDAMLPPWGLVVDGPRFAAFYALRWNGQDYPGGALFTLRGADGERLDSARRVRVFHAFGHPAIRWHNRVHEVSREKTIER